MATYEHYVKTMLYCYVLIKTTSSASPFETCHSKHMPGFDGKKVSDCPLDTHQGVESTSLCVIRCWENHQCRSLMFNRATGVCSIFAVGYSDVTNTFNPVSDEVGAKLYTACQHSHSYGTRCYSTADCVYTSARCASHSPLFSSATHSDSPKRCICADWHSFDPSTGNCLKRPYIDCYVMQTSGLSFYEGPVKTTVSGHTCQIWDVQSPHSHSQGTTASDFATGESMVAIANYCRVPLSDGTPTPWCFTTSSTRWEFCPVPQCLPTGNFIQRSGIDCYVMQTSGLSFYEGPVKTTVSGHTCQRWDVQSPHSHSQGTTASDFATGESMDAIANYCRVSISDRTPTPWCFTTSSTRWEFCPVPECL